MQREDESAKGNIPEEGTQNNLLFRGNIFSKITQTGMTSLRVESKGVSVASETEVFFRKQVYANHLSSKKVRSSFSWSTFFSLSIESLNSCNPLQGKRLKISNEREIILNSLTQDSGQDPKKNPSGVKGKVLIGSSVVGATASQLVVRDPSGKLLLLVDKNNLVIATQKLNLKNPMGIKFNCSVQAPSILGGLISPSNNRSDAIESPEASPSYSMSPSTQLKIESLSRGINILGPEGTSFSSDRGNIDVLSLKDWRFTSRAGRVSPFMMFSLFWTILSVSLELSSNLLCRCRLFFFADHVGCFFHRFHGITDSLSYKERQDLSRNTTTVCLSRIGNVVHVTTRRTVHLFWYL